MKSITTSKIKDKNLKVYHDQKFSSHTIPIFKLCKSIVFYLYVLSSTIALGKYSLGIALSSKSNQILYDKS